MSSISPSQMVMLVALGIFLIIVFWRVAIPVIAALVLAKVLVSIAAMTQQLPIHPASALAAAAPLLLR